MKNSYLHPDEFSWYDIKCAVLVLLPIIIIGVVLGLGVIWLVHPASADTLIVHLESDNHDMRVSRVANENLTTIIAGGGTLLDNTHTVSLIASGTSGVYSTLRRALFGFNTSSIPDDTIIDTVIFSSKGNSDKSNGFTTVPNIVLTDVGGTITFSKDDYQTAGTTILANNISYASWGNATTWNNFTWTPNGINYVNKTGYTKFMMRFDYDGLGGTSPVWSSGQANYVYWTGGTSGPTLTITYHLPDTTPPASITNLDNVTTCNSMDFTFDIPADADYGGLEYWLNGTLQSPNLTASDTHKLFSDLIENTEYTFSTKTFDTTGNVNATFVNRTSTTDICPPSPIVASFTSNTTSGVAPLAVQFNDTSTNTPTGWNWSYQGLNLLSGNQANGTENTNVLDGFGEWQGSESISSDATEYWQGSRSFKIVTLGAVSSEGGQINGFVSTNLKKGVAYTSSVYLKGNGTIILGFSDLPSWGETYSGVITLADAWTRYNVTHTIRSDNNGNFFISVITSTQQVATIYTDGWQLEEGSVATPWQMPANVESIDDLTINPVYFSELQNPEYIFVQPGNFSIQLNASNSNGYNITPGLYWINVSAGDIVPFASFTLDKNYIRIPDTITATDTSTNTPTSWEWSWGDGSVNSTTQNPSHQYLKRGKWDIVMTATNAGGSSTTAATEERVTGYENYYN